MYSACNTLGIHPVVVSSVGSSAYGANTEDLLIIDIENILFNNGNLSTRSGAASLGGRNGKMGLYLGKGYIFSEAKKYKMPNETIEGAELITEIGPKIKIDFDIKVMPLMIGVTNAILDDKKLKICWDYFQ